MRTSFAALFLLHRHVVIQLRESLNYKKRIEIINGGSAALKANANQTSASMVEHRMRNHIKSMVKV